MTSYIADLGSLAEIVEEEDDKTKDMIATCDKGHNMKRSLGIKREKAKGWKNCKVCKRPVDAVKEVIIYCEKQNCNFFMCERCGTCEHGHTLMVSNYNSASSEIPSCARRHFQVRTKAININEYPDKMPTIEERDGYRLKSMKGVPNNTVLKNTEGKKTL